MCGIIASKGRGTNAKNVLDGLQQLEYRGYDSSGVGVFSHGALLRERMIGSKNRDALATKVMSDINFLDASVAIGHTRWATHGGVSVENAHPHTDSDNTILLVHNGIVENTEELKSGLDFNLEGETDTEIFTQYIGHHVKTKSLLQTLQMCIEKARGEWNIVCIDKNGALAAVRHSGQTMVYGMDDSVVTIGSDEQALPASITEVYEIPYNHIVLVGEDNTLRVYTNDAQIVELAPRTRCVFPICIEEGEMMFKEIQAQEETLKKLALSVRAQEKTCASIREKLLSREYTDIIITACGTSYHAGLAVKQQWEKMFQKPVTCVVASEMRSVLRDLSRTYVFALSQSGSTQDVLDAILHARAQGASYVCAVTNKPYSAIREKTDALVEVSAGPEFGVAATKTFTHTVLTLHTISGDISGNDIEQFIPHVAHVVSDATLPMKEWAEKIAHAKTVLYLGKHSLFPIALEGALKLKEISYIHAEGFASGELKHGPIALIEEGTPVIVCMQKGETEHLVQGSIREVEARGAQVFVVAEEGVSYVHKNMYTVPSSASIQIMCTIPLQYLAYYTACALDKNPDKPRNLAKSVTVL